MFPGGYFPKTYFAGTYWAPPDGGSIPVDPGTLFNYQILRRVQRR